MEYELKAVTIGWGSRFRIFLIRLLLKPFLRWVLAGPLKRVVWMQLMVAGQPCRNTAGLPQGLRIVNGVPGYTIGDLGDTAKPLILYLHGGAFIIPAAPDVHLHMLAVLCRELGAVGFMPDYRLAPFNKFPAALDDCERAYRGVLAAGFVPARIAVCGESAGGNLTLGLLQRIRKAGLGMPACAVPISPVTDMGRAHLPPSRTALMKRDAMLSLPSLAQVTELYVGAWDTADPELSPLYADYAGFPPLYFLASDSEILLDDSVLAAGCARAAGVDVRLDVWPLLPHAFPLFGRWFPEVAEARDDIAAFIRRWIPGAAACPAPAEEHGLLPEPQDMAGAL